MLKLLAVGALAFLATRAQAAFMYQITDLGILAPGGSSVAYSVSDNGTYAAGYADGNKAFRWTSPGPIAQIPNTFGGNQSGAEGVNNVGATVGFATNGGGQGHGFLHQNAGPMQDLGVLAGGQTSTALDINNFNTVVGRSDGAAGSRATRWTQPGGLVSLGVLAAGNSSSAHAVNDQEQVTGSSNIVANGNSHAFRWQQVGGFTDLGLLPGGTFSDGEDISSAGTITGQANGGAFGAQAMLWIQGPGMQNLGTIAGDATSIGEGVNAVGQVVGLSGVSHPFIWTQADGMINLNTLIDPGSPGWNLMDATAINNAGVIVGDGTFNGTDHAFMATPLTPEPGSALLVVTLGCGALTRSRRRSR